MTKPLKLRVGSKVGEVSALLDRPPDAWSVLALAHGAGAGMRHPFLEGLVERLAARGMAALRYQFPYMERGERRPNPPGILIATVRAAVGRAAEEELPLFAGGKSLGGRMTTTAAAQTVIDDLRGIVLFGFPLHAPGRPSSDRGEHLASVDVPTLFLQGTRDTLADLALLRPVIASLGERATLHVVEGGDHSFHMLKRSGRSDTDALDEIAGMTASWARELV